MLGGENLCLQGDQFKDGIEVNAREFDGKRFPDPLVFVEYLSGNR